MKLARRIARQRRFKLVQSYLKRRGMDRHFDCRGANAVKTSERTAYRDWVLGFGRFMRVDSRDASR